MEDRTVRLEIEALEDGESITPDCVVWNAWIDKCHGIADMEDEDYKKYVCVEPGFVRSHRAVKPHHQFALKQRITVEEKWCVSFTNKANLWFRPMSYSMWDCFLVERAIFSSFFSCSRRCL